VHREFRKLLEQATGVSGFIIAVNIDVRGFSPFSMKVDSSETAIFIKSIYRKLIDGYFSDASFFKPAGDGLLIMLPYTEENLKEKASKSIATCLSVLKDFHSFCANEPMVNFEVPEAVGIGLSRGAACRLVSGDKTLDYSGRVLNLASRLMDLARPCGVVFDSGFGIQLLPKVLRNKFSRTKVYIRGIAEKEPVEILYTKEHTRISPMSKKPYEKIKWKTVTDARTLREIKTSLPRRIYSLPSEPLDSEQLIVRIEYPAVYKGARKKGLVVIARFNKFEYYMEAGEPTVSVSYEALAKKLEKEGVKDSWEVKIEIMYPEQ